jgi:hypothetical protein
VAAEASATVYLNWVVTGMDRASGTLRDFETRLLRLSQTGKAAFTGIAGGLIGLIRSGAAGTTEMNRLNYSLSEVRLELASAFAPWLRRVVDWTDKLAVSMRRMTGETQEAIRSWAKFGLTLSAVVAILPRAMGLAAPGAVLRGLGLAAARPAAAAAGAAAATGAGAAAAARGGMLGMFAGALGPWALVAGIGMLAAQSARGREALAALGESARKLAPALNQLSEAAAGVVGAFATIVAWVINNVPGAQSKTGAPLGTAFLGGALGRLVGGAPGMIIGTLAGWLTGYIADKMLEADPKERARREGDPTLLRQRIAELEAGLEKERGKMLPAQIEMTAGLIARYKTQLEGISKATLTPATGGFESPADLYRRLAGTIVKTAQDKTAENTGKTANIIEQIQKMLEALARKAGVDAPPQQP